MTLGSRAPLGRVVAGDGADASTTDAPAAAGGTVDGRDPDRIVGGLRAWLVSAATSPTGAFHAWVDAHTGEPSFEYPEITGYALTHLSALTDPSEHEIEVGLRAAAWLARRVDSGDLSARDGWEGGAVYSFDLGMIAAGLMAFGHRFDRAATVQTGRRLAGLLRDRIEADGTLVTVGPRPSDVAPRPRWSVEGSAHLLKVAQCLLWADRLGTEGCRRAADRLVSTASGLQDDDGRFVTDPSDQETILHAHCYAISGLWIYARATHDRSVLERARRAVVWAWRHQLVSGGFPRAVPAGGETEPYHPVEQMDVTCQAVRAAVLVGARPAGLPAAIARLGEVAVRARDGRCALPYQPAAQTVHFNVWTSLFGVQALGMVIPEATPVEWDQLV